MLRWKVFSTREDSHLLWGAVQQDISYHIGEVNRRRRGWGPIATFDSLNSAHVFAERIVGDIQVWTVQTSRAYPFKYLGEFVQWRLLKYQGIRYVPFGIVLVSWIKPLQPVAVVRGMYLPCFMIPQDKLPQTPTPQSANMVLADSEKENWHA